MTSTNTNTDTDFYNLVSDSKIGILSRIAFPTWPRHKRDRTKTAFYDRRDVIRAFVSGHLEDAEAICLAAPLPQSFRRRKAAIDARKQLVDACRKLAAARLS